ncbi:MAG: 50S ribosomal protein L17, partial [Ignavibacteria bacterium]|nr:50S ribosomal protein L17 [Ignavibacteria bacterium]
PSHRKSTLSSLATALFRHKRIKTTIAKAKETRTFAEKLITIAKRRDIHSRRLVARFIKDREVVKSLFGELVDKIGTRPGGYTRVVKLGHRLGDGADLAILELVDFNEGTVKATPKASAQEKKEKADVKEAKVVEEKKEEVKPTKTDSVEEPSEKTEKQ